MGQVSRGQLSGDNFPRIIFLGDNFLGEFYWGQFCEDIFPRCFLLHPYFIRSTRAVLAMNSDECRIAGSD